MKDCRPAEDGTAIRRRRICPDCGGRFTTFERVQLRELMVLKKTGRKVPFDRDKLVRSFEIALRKRPVDAGPHRARGLRHRPAAGKLRRDAKSPRRRSACRCLSRSKSLDDVASCATPLFIATSPISEDFREDLSEITAKIARDRRQRLAMAARGED